MGASESLAATMQQGTDSPGVQAPSAVALNSLRENLQKQLGTAVDSEEVLRLLQAVRDLALAHGPAAIKHCLQIIESTATFLGQVSATEGES
jgi:hypothetical protein